MEPKEGTILTVINDWINAIHRVSSNITDFKILLTHGLKEALISLSETPKKLDVLSKAGVVDAGAQGFVDILEGINNFIHSGSVEERTTEAIIETPLVVEVLFMKDVNQFNSNSKNNVINDEVGIQGSVKTSCAARELDAGRGT